MKCSIDSDYGESPDLLDVKTVKARKLHRCCECGSAINYGDKYERVKGLWDGGFDIFKTCLVCARIRSDFFCSYVYGHLWEDLRESMYEGGDYDDVCWLTGSLR